MPAQRRWPSLDLAAGQSQHAQFTLTRADLAFLGEGLRETVKPGVFQMWIAS
ncbi:MAG: fibronectin type III-like domain-contianing protein, partial [Novosphingobium sp.]